MSDLTHREGESVVRRFAGLFAPGRKPKRHDNAAHIKAEVRRLLGLSDDIVVMVNEIACAAGNCPDVETVIVILWPGGASPPIRIDCPIAAVEISSLREILHARISGSFSDT